MKRYYLIYKRLLIANWNVLIEYRSDFVTSMFAGFMFSSYHVITVLLLTYKVQFVYGWTRNELLLLSATYSVFIGVYHMFVSHNLDRLADEILYGRLDYMLLKPIDSQFAASLWKIHYVAVIRLIFGLGLSFYLMHIMQIHLTVSTLLLYGFVILVGVCMLYSLWLPFISLMIFNPRLSNIVSFLFNLSNMARYPKEMYARLPLVLFVPLIPLALIMTTPTKVLVQKFSVSLGLELLLVCLILGVFARFFWKFSLRHYSSASS